MNLSLAADSTDSWQIDALARAVRSDDNVNLFSSRGPTRGSFVNVNGVRRIDNLLKPDLVAPGNKVLGARSVDNFTLWHPSALPVRYPQLTQVTGSSSQGGESVMMLSGTSVAAPVVAGAVALMLQANPGLTPPLIKAILPCSAQPVAGANLLQQGAGLLNIAGAVQLAQALRTDVASGKAMPTTSTTLNGQTINWSRIGDALFTQFQPVNDRRPL